jgi:hypothetical protein
MSLYNCECWNCCHVNRKRIVGVVGIEAFYYVVFVFFSEMERRLPMNRKVDFR